MNAYNYPSNSHKSKEQKEASMEKRANKVVKGAVKTRKNDAAKLADLFIAEDIKSVGSHIVTDVIVPMIKNGIVDIVNRSVNMIFFGGGANRNNRNSNVPYVSYNTVSANNNDRFANQATQTRTSFRTDDFVFTTRTEAEDVLAQLDGIMETYKMVRVLDFYDTIGKTCDHTAARFGWMSMGGARIEPVRGGFVIRMPRPIPIE